MKSNFLDCSNDLVAAAEVDHFRLQGSRAIIELFEDLSPKKRMSSDTGSGKGFGAVLLSKRHPKAPVLAIDLNSSELHYFHSHIRFISISTHLAIAIDRSLVKVAYG